LKATKHIFLLLALLTLSFLAEAQVRVTGHVCAEIVEAASVSSATNNLLALNRSQAVENLDLGQITLNGGQNALCALVVNSNNIVGESGSTLSFTASPAAEASSGIMDQSGSRVFNFNGAADPSIQNNSDHSYQGQYDVTFAYN
jgi:hypothetical protein